MKKIYMQPRTDVCELNVTQHMLAGSMSGQGAGTEDIHFGGEDNTGIGGDVKGNEWGDIWD